MGVNRAGSWRYQGSTWSARSKNGSRAGSYTSNIEKALVIRGDGKSQEVYIDRNRSLEAGNFNPEQWVNLRWANPGLYKMFPTDDPEVFYITRMSSEEIRDGKYTVGYSRTSNAILSRNYIELTALENPSKLPENDRIDYYNNWRTYGPILQENGTVSTPEHTITSNSHVYGLNYYWWSTRNDYDAVLTTYGADDGNLIDYVGEQVDKSLTNGGCYNHNEYLREHTESQTNSNYRYWNNNRMLVHYDGSGNVIYAISFANIDPYNVDRSFARDVWERIRRRRPSTASSVRSTAGSLALTSPALSTLPTARSL